MIHFDVHDFFWPKNALSLKTAHWVAHRLWMTKEEVEEKFGEAVDPLPPLGLENEGRLA